MRRHRVGRYHVGVREDGHERTCKYTGLQDAAHERLVKGGRNGREIR